VKPREQPRQQLQGRTRRISRQNRLTSGSAVVLIGRTWTLPNRCFAQIQDGVRSPSCPGWHATACSQRQYTIRIPRLWCPLSVPPTTPPQRDPPAELTYLVSADVLKVASLCLSLPAPGIDQPASKERR